MYLPGGGRPAPPVPAHLNTCDSADSLGTEHGTVSRLPLRTPVRESLRPRDGLSQSRSGYGLQATAI